MGERRYLSIGEVLGLLLEEFPDITISKIRFLESQGLIDPERTPSGYRKFYEVDVERLRLILREQRENFLPLKVIKDRLDSGELLGEGDATPTGGIRLPRPRVASLPASAGPVVTSVVPAPAAVPLAVAVPPATTREAERQGDVDPPQLLRASPAPAVAPTAPPGRPPEPLVPLVPISRPAPTLVPPPPPSVDASGPISGPIPRPARAVTDGGLSDDEVCSIAGVERSFLAELEEYGLVAGRQRGAMRIYDEDAVHAVVAAAGLCRRGLQPRHLRQWRTTVDKEIALIEQLVLPLLRQRNPRAHEQASAVAHDIEVLGGELREALARSALRNLIG